jgi:hypothetical protein
MSILTFLADTNTDNSDFQTSGSIPMRVRVPYLLQAPPGRQLPAEAELRAVGRSVGRMIRAARERERGSCRPPQRVRFGLLAVWGSHPRAHTCTPVRYLVVQFSFLQPPRRDWKENPRWPAWLAWPTTAPRPDELRELSERATNNNRVVTVSVRWPCDLLIPRTSKSFFRIRTACCHWYALLNLHIVRRNGDHVLASHHEFVSEIFGTLSRFIKILNLN